MGGFGQIMRAVRRYRQIFPSYAKLLSIDSKLWQDIIKPRYYSQLTKVMVRFSYVKYWTDSAIEAKL